MELFLNPWYMVAGGAMVSSPVLIHLINRMRFKRVRWAAMEFLLKSQKRNRRRLIVEQLILLLLRCLLVLLAALLVARFVGSALGLTPTTSTTHVILLDDTLSMTDQAPKNQTPGPDCFAVAKNKIERLARFASEANSPQRLVILPLSDPKTKLFDESLNRQGALTRLAETLQGVKATPLHTNPLLAIEQGLKDLGESRETKRWLHIFSDFRDADWGKRSGSERLYEVLTQSTDLGINVTLIDCVAPERASGPGGKQVEHHNNYALTELKPEKRIAPGGTLVPFSVEIENLGMDSRENLFLEVHVDGRENQEASTYYPAPAPGARVRHSFNLLFEAPGETQRSQFHRVTANIMAAPGINLDAEAGVLGDNLRHAIIEIRKEVPTLVIDGSAEEGLKPEGDTRTVMNALESTKGNEAVKVVIGTLDELLRPDLEREYATIYLLNMENLRGRKDKDGKGEDLPLKRLSDFVRNGGKVVFFTGDKIDVTYYNKVLFEQNQGLFPIPLDRQMTDRISEEEIERRKNSASPKIYVLDNENEVTVGLASVQFKIPDLIIPQYSKAKDRFEWTAPNWARSSDLTELITMANLKKLDDNTNSQVDRMLKRIPTDKSEYKKYQELLNKNIQQIRAAMGGRADELYKLAEALDAMLNDRGPKPGDKDNVSLVEFWALPELKDLKEDMQAFRKDALYGDPLVVSRKVGKGGVVAVLTTAGTKWSGWSGGKDGGVSSFTFPMFMVDLQKFLTRGGDGGERLVGEALTFDLDEKQYQGKLQRVFQIDPRGADLGRIETDPTLKAPPGMQAQPERTLQSQEGRYQLAIPNTTETGVVYYRIFPQGGKEPEERWFAYNVDTAAESNLRRAATEEVVRPINPNEVSPNKGTMSWFNPEESQDLLRERKADLSELPWLFLLFLVVLIVEQALAVHLSFHVKGGEGSLGSASGTTPAPASAVAA